MKFLKKHKIIIYAALIMLFDLITRGEFEIGGGTVVMIGAILTVLYSEHEKKSRNSDPF